MSKILRLSPLFPLLKEYETREGLILMVQGHLALATRGGYKLSPHALQGLIKINKFAIAYLSTGVTPTEVKRSKPLKVEKGSSLVKPSKDELEKVKVYLMRYADSEKSELILLQKLLQQAEEVLAI